MSRAVARTGRVVASLGRVVVIGVGNPYRRDDGVGPAVVARLRERQAELGPTTVDLVECDGEPSRLLALWEGASTAVVVDAARTVTPQPGRVHRRSLHHPGTRPGAAAASSHGVDLGDAVALAQALDRLPTTLLLYTIEAADTSFGEGLTPAVAGAAARLADEIATDLLGL